MPKVTAPLFSATASGAFAGVAEFRMVNGKAIVTAPKRMNKTQTPVQQANAARFREAISGWKALTPVQQDPWKTKGLIVKLTGYQLYLREYIRQGIVPPGQPTLPA